MGGIVQCAEHGKGGRVWNKANDSVSFNENRRYSDDSSTNRRCCPEGSLSYPNSDRIRTVTADGCVSNLQFDDRVPKTNSLICQLKTRLPRLFFSSRLGSKALLISSLLCAVFRTSCSSGLKPIHRTRTLWSRNLLCVPCPEVLGPATSPYKHPKPRQPSSVSLLARGLLPDDLIQKCHGIDDMEGSRSSLHTAAASGKKKSCLGSESHGDVYDLRGANPEILTATHNGRIGSADWSMTEEEFQQRSEDFDDVPFEFAPVLKPTADRERSAAAAAAAVAAAAANIGRLKLSEKTAEEETCLGMMESNFAPLELECAWRCIPHPLKVARGGEDVHMICRAGGATLLGVFDGVGGWAELGVDPADYARRLVAGIEREFRRDPGMCDWQERPLLTMLNKAYEDLKLEDFPGSCTACLVMLNSLGQLHILNLGDSGMHVLRDGLSAFSTNEQQHYFNCPFQLGMGSDDTPSKADYFILDELAEDDVLVLATDGVWDNMYEEDMTRIVQDLAGRPSSIARSLAEMSHAHGRDPYYASPFSTNAAARGLRYMGGKLDDVTVVVSRVRRVPVAAQGARGSVMASAGARCGGTMAGAGAGAGGSS
uniref:Protein phosphatase n=1 Tax=Cryptomonas curvata TaxID=233186 RepID=A0A7S0MYG8_9CRYP|mmetsp:Transcript_57536/g.120315  ORF Transcript_57536/g.120315 Transcript_57536/m.120315 type:complete len:597 (+) Transcript_57536:143-1933(+)